jgi:hypothetical protein
MFGALRYTQVAKRKVSVHYCKKKRRSLTRYHEQRSPGASMSYRRVFSDEIAFAAYQQDSGGIQGPFGILGAFE